jgi:curved DNA-binding protein CbpA
MENIRESLYDLIGVQRDASQDEIEKACLSLGDLHRPDRNPGNAYYAAKFAAIERAYLILSNPVTREAHDRHLPPAVERQTTVTDRRQSRSPGMRNFAAGIVTRVTRSISTGTSRTAIPTK